MIPLQIMGTIPNDNVLAMREHLDANYLATGFMTPDVSNYAKGRQRCWLQAEAPLGKTRPWGPGRKDKRLWPWLLENVWSEADLGLVTYGDVAIAPHRDASYAGFEAYTVNLGEVEAWYYETGYEDFKYGPQPHHRGLTIDLHFGDVIRFNPKNQHGPVNPAPDRWSIHLWHVKDEFRTKFEEARG